MLRDLQRARRGTGPFGRLAHRLSQMLYGTTLYHYSLVGTRPDGLHIIPPDPWPGEAPQGQSLLQGRFALAGQTIEVGANPWWPKAAGRDWLMEMHSFDWIRDLRAVGSDAARRCVRALVDSWMELHPRWCVLAWEPDVLAQRLSAWLGQYEFFAAGADDEFRERLFASLGRQARHLARSLPADLQGSAYLHALKGLIQSGVALPGGQERTARGLRLLEHALPLQVLPDGGHVERSPAVQLQVLRILIDIRATLTAAKEEIPTELQNAIDRMAPMLRFFRHGDGGLALFNGAREDEAWRIEMVLAQADAKGKPPPQAPHTGFQRLSANRTLLLVDTGAAPAPGLDERAHAGCLSFEMSHGRERLIVNCGSHVGGSPTWRQVQRATAAHSTLTVDDTNSSEVLAGGGIGRRPQTVSAHREQAEGNLWLEASHDGYRHSYKLVHQRRLFVSANGEDVRGEDVLVGRGGHSYSIRFHLHPDVTVALSEDASTARLGLPSGPGWTLRVGGGGGLGVQDSIYLGKAGTVTPTRQLVINGTLDGEGTKIRWAIQREQKKG